jgi:hypothetical protein
MRVSSQSIALIWFVAPISVGAALGAAACAPPQDDFDATNSNVQASTPLPTTVVPTSAPATMSPPVAPSTVPVVVPTTNTAAAATSAAPPVVTPSATPPAVSTPETTPSTAATMKPAGGVGNDIVANDDFWVPASSNGVGVEGSWYAYADPTCGTGKCKGDGTDVAGAADSTTVVMSYEEPGTVCIKGSTTLLVAGMEGDTWGAGLGFNFADGDAWDGSTYSGIEFTAAATSGGDVQVQLEMDGITPGQEHQVALTAGKNTIQWGDVEQPDWVETAEAFDKSKVVSVKFKVESIATAETYSVCISGLKVLP